MHTYHNKRFPNESDEYRKARNALLTEEKNLREQLESVVAQRRKLPRGGKLKENYVFEEIVKGKIVKTPFERLFRPHKNSLVIYSMMFAPNDDKACPMCTSIVDGLNGESPHINGKINFVVIGKAPIEKLHKYAKERGWENIRLLSSSNNSYNIDYFAQDNDGNQMPILNVFEKRKDGMHHFYGTELLYVPTEKGQDFRHVDLIWPLWNMFDLTPEGRGTDWYPDYSYPKET